MKSSALRMLLDTPLGKLLTFWYSWEWWGLRSFLSLLFMHIFFLLNSMNLAQLIDCFCDPSQELSICYHYWSCLDVLQLLHWSSWWIQGFEEVPRGTTCLFIHLSRLSSQYLPWSNGLCHNLGLFLYILVCSDILKRLERPISDVSSIWDASVSSNLPSILLFLVIAHSAL